MARGGFDRDRTRIAIDAQGRGQHLDPVMHLVAFLRDGPGIARRVSIRAAARRARNRPGLVMAGQRRA